MMSGGWYAADGVRYHVECVGQGEPLLLLHGFAWNAAGWDAQTAQLARSRRLIMPDLLGHGKTDAPDDAARYTIEAAAADLAGMLSRPKTTEPHSPAPFLCSGEGELGGMVDVLGYSMGGRLALYFALAYPEKVRRLILESASPGLATEAERAARRAGDEAMADDIERGGVEAFVLRWERMPLFTSYAALPLEVRLRMRALRFDSQPHGLANSLRGMGTGAQPSLWGRLGELKMPVLLIAGALDHKFREIALQMSQSIPQAQVTIIPEAGHTPHLEQPAAFNAAVEAFLG